MPTGQTLSAERVSQDSTVRISLPGTLSKGSSSTLTFEYEGTVQSADDSPVPGLKLAYIGDPITYLLYAGGWFPMVGYGTNRFTSTISISVPAGYTVIGSGKETTGEFPRFAMEAAPARMPARRAPRRARRPASWPSRRQHDLYLHLRQAELSGNHSDRQVRADQEQRRRTRHHGLHLAQNKP